MMLPFPGRQQLKTLLLEISKQEKQLEVLRQILSEQYDFEPYSAFQRLDVERKGFINTTDIQNFLFSADFQATETEIMLYVNRYAREDPSSIIYSEFLPTILPQNNSDLRTIVTQRNVYSITPEQSLPYEVEYALARVIMKEIKSFQELDPFKISLHSQYAFSYKSAFSSLDIHHSDFIDYLSLKDFFKKNGSNPPEEDLIAILQRVDRDEDGRITYEDFVQAITPLSLNFPVSNIDEGSQGFMEEKRSSNLKPTSQSTEKEIPSRLHRSPIQTTSAKSNKGQRENLSSSQDGPPNKNLSKAKKDQTSKTTGSGRNENLNKNTLINKEFSLGNKKADILEGLLRVLREIVNLERELETAKEDLAIRPDFNLFDSFRLFDKKAVGTVSAGDIEQGLNEVGIYPKKEELYLFVRKFDKNADARLKFSDFCDGFVPMQTEYVKLLKSRPCVNTDQGFNIKQAFSYQTLRLFKGLLLLHLENETVLEALRQKLAKDPRFDINKVFETIDRDEDGFITLYEFRDIMEKYDMFITERDLTYLINRFDKESKQKISYIEFVQEITPKSQKDLPK